MDSLLKERFARLGQIQDVNHVRSGTRVHLVARLRDDVSRLQPVDATLALARRGVKMLAAKRYLEELADGGRRYIVVPVVEDVGNLVKELRDAGLVAAPMSASQKVDVAELRARLRLSREQFALRFGFELESVRNWESGRREPDTAAKSYLRVIDRNPEFVEEAVAPALQAWA